MSKNNTLKKVNYEDKIIHLQKNCFYKFTRQEIVTWKFVRNKV